MKTAAQKASMALWRSKNIAHVQEYAKRYRAIYNKENAEKIHRSVRAYQKRHQKQIRIYKARWQKEKMRDPQFRIKRLFRTRFYQVLRGLKKSSSVLTLLGCSAEEATQHIASQFTAGMSWDNHGFWHIDHKKPLAKFDLTDPTQLAQAFHYTNLQPLWAFDNLSKGAR